MYISLVNAFLHAHILQIFQPIEVMIFVFLHSSVFVCSPSSLRDEGHDISNQPLCLISRSSSNLLIKLCHNIQHLYMCLPYLNGGPDIYQTIISPRVSSDSYSRNIQAFRGHFVCFCCFTSHVNSYGHCGTVSSLNHTFSWAGLSKRLTSNLCTYFRL